MIFKIRKLQALYKSFPVTRYWIEFFASKHKKLSPVVYRKNILSLLSVAHMSSLLQCNAVVYFIPECIIEHLHTHYIIWIQVIFHFIAQIKSHYDTFIKITCCTSPPAPFKAISLKFKHKEKLLSHVSAMRKLNVMH